MQRLIKLAVLVTLFGCLGLVESKQLSRCFYPPRDVKNPREETNKLIKNLTGTTCENFMCVFVELDLMDTRTRKLKLKNIQKALKSSNPTIAPEQIKKCVNKQNKFIDSQTKYVFVDQCKSWATAYKCLGLHKSDYLNTN